MIKIDGISIKGISCCVAENIEYNLQVPGFDEARKEKIIQTTGVKQRRVVSKDTCTSDLELIAAKELIKSLGIDLSEIGVLINLTQTPDYILPSTSHVLHKELELSESTIAFDVNLGCSAYIYGLYLAASLLKTASCKYALVLVGDTISKYSSPQDASTLFLFGDAGAATLIEKTDDAQGVVFSLGSDGRGWQNLIIPAGANRNKGSKDTSVIKADSDGNARSVEHLFMDGMEIFNFTISTVVPHIQKLIDACGMPETVVFHQANKYMLEFMRKSLKIRKESFLYSLEDYGNTSSASLPLTLCLHNERIKQNPSVLLSGFGVGYSWGSALIDLSNTKILEILEYDENHGKVNR